MCMYISHPLYPFIHLLINTWIASIFWDILNDDSVNIGVYISFQISVFIFSDIYSGVEFLDHVIVLFLVFW